MSIYSITVSNAFKKDIKKYKHKPKALKALYDTLELLKNGADVPKHMRPHKLIGKYKDTWECHVLNDFLIIWEVNELGYEIHLIRAGSHSELFL